MKPVQEVSIIVNSIDKAEKENFFKLNISFIKDKEPRRNYDYIRKCFKDNYNRWFVIIDGCRITFREKIFGNNNYQEYELIKVDREYDTKGRRRKSTESQVGKHSKTRAPKDWNKRDDVQPQIPIMPELEEIDKILDDLDLKDLEKVEEENEENKEWEEAEKIVAIPKKVRHEKYNLIKDCLESDIPVYLAGPAGSGKNYTVEQIARENGWNFYYTNSVQQEFKLTGFIDAGGTYRDTEFYKACTDEEECIFFLDEIDASIPEALVLINAAIANGYFEFPNGKVVLGNVHFVAAGNTVGSGADELYTGRMVLDQATLDRFAIIEFDYSEQIELKLTEGNQELVTFIRELREKAKSNGVRATFSYRCLIMVTKLEKAGTNLTDIMDIVILKGLDKDTRRTLRLGYVEKSKYYKALDEMFQQAS